jgi:hypothetical protein
MSLPTKAEVGIIDTIITLFTERFFSFVISINRFEISTIDDPSARHSTFTELELPKALHNRKMYAKLIAQRRSRKSAMCFSCKKMQMCPFGRF